MVYDAEIGKDGRREEGRKGGREGGRGRNRQHLGRSRTFLLLPLSFILPPSRSSSLPVSLPSSSSVGSLDSWGDSLLNPPKSLSGARFGKEERKGRREDERRERRETMKGGREEQREGGRGKVNTQSKKLFFIKQLTCPRINIYSFPSTAIIK